MIALVTGAPPQDVLFRLIDVVSQDTGLSAGVRRAARDLVPVAQDAPGLAWDRLLGQARRTAADLPRESPTEDLLRYVGIASFHLHHLSDDVRAYFPDPAAYESVVSDDHDPAARLEADLDRSEPLFPADHSWLVPASEMAIVASGSAAKAALETSTEPPFVVFRLSLARLLAEGVTVRRPRGVDAVPGCYLQWRPAGVAGGQNELIDRDVPQACLEDLTWLP